MKAIALSITIGDKPFHFHNIIPSICRNMDFDQKAIRKAMFLGTFIGLIMNLIWVFPDAEYWNVSHEHMTAH